ncbi:MAG: Polyhydroxybutyrate depolymerase [Dehalococcoidia bacterium]|nr:Polyhydroxybutyrate depolymerase [Dehalococcoidia bacterium]
MNTRRSSFASTIVLALAAYPNVIRRMVTGKLFTATLASALVTLVVLPLPLSAQTQTLVLKPSSTVIGVGGVGYMLAVYDADGPSGPQLEQYLDPSALAWSSNSKTVAAVDVLGTVSGLKKGAAIITAKYRKKNLTATAQVQVAGTVVSFDVDTPDERTRSYLLFIPESYKQNTPTPLVLTFHGGGGDPDYVVNNTQMNVTANQKGFLAAYPHGTGFFEKMGTWNAGICCGFAMINKVDDVGFTSAVIADIKAKYTVDSAKIYATGMSNGAMMVHRLACELSDQIAAIGPVAGGINVGGDFSVCLPTRPVSVIEFHGTTDDTYPYSGGLGVDGVSLYPITQTIADWVNRNGIDSRTGSTTYQAGIERCETYSSTLAEVRLCTAQPPTKIKVNGVIYDGGGHAWPGGVKGRHSEADVPTTDISASAVMWEFFNLHPKQP